jgi:hypothetical protein
MSSISSTNRITRLIVRSDNFLPTRDSAGMVNSYSSITYPSAAAFYIAYLAFLYSFAIRVSRISRITLITREVRVPAREAFPAL